MGHKVWVWGVRYGMGHKVWVWGVRYGMGHKVWVWGVRYGMGYGHIALPSAAQQSSDEGLATAVRETMI